MKKFPINIPHFSSSFYSALSQQDYLHTLLNQSQIIWVDSDQNYGLIHKKTLEKFETEIQKLRNIVGSLQGVNQELKIRNAALEQFLMMKNTQNQRLKEQKCNERLQFKKKMSILENKLLKNQEQLNEKSQILEKIVLSRQPTQLKTNSFRLDKKRNEASTQTLFCSLRPLLSNFKCEQITIEPSHQNLKECFAQCFRYFNPIHQNCRQSLEDFNSNLAFIEKKIISLEEFHNGCYSEYQQLIKQNKRLSEQNTTLHKELSEERLKFWKKTVKDAVNGIQADWQASSIKTNELFLKNQMLDE